MHLGCQRSGYHFSSVCLCVCLYVSSQLHWSTTYIISFTTWCTFQRRWVFAKMQLSCVCVVVCVCVCVCVCVSVFCLMYVLRMRLTPGLSPPLPRGMNGALCSPPQYDLFSSLNKSNARCAFVCFLVSEILSATDVQQRDRSELKISGDHACAPMGDVDFGARVDWQMLLSP